MKSKRCFIEVSRIFHACFMNSKFQGSFKKFSGLFQWCFEFWGSLREFQGYFREVLRMIQGSFRDVYMKYFKTVSSVLQSFWCASRQFQGCVESFSRVFQERC